MILEEERGQRALQKSGSGSLSQVEETGTGGGEQAESLTSETSHPTDLYFWEKIQLVLF